MPNMTTPTPDGSGAAKGQLAINEVGNKPEDRLCQCAWYLYTRKVKGAITW